MEEIIKNLFHSIENTEEIIQFADNLPDECQRVFSYYTLLKEIKKSKGLNGIEVMLIAYRIKQVKETNVQVIYNYLSPGIRALIWNPYVKIENGLHSDLRLTINTNIYKNETIFRSDEKIVETYWIP